jgi:hypothetical protein
MQCALQLPFLLQTLADHASAVVPEFQSCISCPVEVEPGHISKVKKDHQKSSEQERGIDVLLTYRRRVPFFCNWRDKRYVK